jgi:hypothetical protein
MSNQVQYIKGTIIIVSVYIGNDPDKCLQIVNCLKQLRKVYNKEIIVTVDNQSLNRDWYNIANEMNMHMIYNDSELYKYEIGAYNLALTYFRADKYIFLQSSVYLHKQIEEELSSTHADAFALSRLSGLNWDNNGLNLINKYLNSVNMDNWNDDPLVLWNCFYCNDLYLEGLKQSGLLDLICNTKDCSCAYERILGCYMYRTLKDVKSIDSSVFTKYWLYQL